MPHFRPFRTLDPRKGVTDKKPDCEIKVDFEGITIGQPAKKDEKNILNSQVHDNMPLIDDHEFIAERMYSNILLLF